MSEAKFTKGPWQVAGQEDTPGCGKYKTLVGSGGNKILDGSWYQCFTGSDADFDLIAAAPEMYAFIEDFMLNIHEITDDAERLLAKARGEQ